MRLTYGYDMFVIWRMFMREQVSAGCLSEIYWFIDLYIVYYVKCKYNNNIKSRGDIDWVVLKVQVQIFYKYAGRYRIKESVMDLKHIVGWHGWGTVHVVSLLGGCVEPNWPISHNLPVCCIHSMWTMCLLSLSIQKRYV